MKILLAEWSACETAAFAIRHAVFVLEQGVPLEMEVDEHDARSVHALALTPEGETVGTARLIPDGHIGRVAVLGAWRGQGYGRALMHTLMTHAAQRGHARVWVHAQCDVQAFYQSLGFVAEGAVFEEAGIAHVRMLAVLPI